MTLSPRIYVACLASYNAGQLVGQWLDVPSDAATLERTIRALLSASPIPGAEEWAIHDTDGFGGLTISEYASTAEVVETATFVRQRGVLGAALANALGSVSAAEHRLAHEYAGSFESIDGWAEAHLEDTGLMDRVPEELRPFLDLTRYAQHHEAGGLIFTLRVEAALHVFWNS